MVILLVESPHNCKYFFDFSLKMKEKSIKKYPHKWTNILSCRTGQNYVIFLAVGSDEISRKSQEKEEKANGVCPSPCFSSGQNYIIFKIINII